MRPKSDNELPARGSLTTVGLNVLFVWLATFLSLAPTFAQEGTQPGSAREPSSSSAGRKANSKQIDIGRVNGEFIQSGGSCVLSSYAIVANYFTGKPIATYFEGYCEHFGLQYKDALDAEQKYAAHFDQEWRKRDCRGYEVILDLHANSKVKCFVEARQRFDGHFYLDSSSHRSELENSLTHNEAFLNITYEPGHDYHSITIIHNGTGFVARDTNKKGLEQISGLSKIGKLRDSVLYVGK